MIGVVVGGARPSRHLTVRRSLVCQHTLLIAIALPLTHQPLSALVCLCLLLSPHLSLSRVSVGEGAPGYRQADNRVQRQAYKRVQAGRKATSSTAAAGWRRGRVKVRFRVRVGVPGPLLLMAASSSHGQR
eukprot:scaffold1143_cov107-Isochrysis_galbana.AAC.7